MRASLPLRARREVQGMILIFREAATGRSPIRSHPGPALPSDTNPFARDPNPPAEGTTPSGLPAWHLKSRARQIGSSQFIDYERKPASTQPEPPTHGVPPNFPDDQLEGRRRIPGWAVWFGGIFVLSIIEDIVVARAREAKRRDEELRGEGGAADGRGPGGAGPLGAGRQQPPVQRDEHGNEALPAGALDTEVAASTSEVADPRKLMRQRRAEMGANQPTSNQWGDAPEAFDATGGRGTFGRG